MYLVDYGTNVLCLQAHNYLVIIAGQIVPIGKFLSSQVGRSHGSNIFKNRRHIR